jgi:nucleotide-binding universal stress UspA family protein
VPYNRQPYADQALLYALAFARSCGGKVTALGVVTGDLASAHKAFGEHLKSVAGKNYARITPHVILGDPKHAILDQARRGGFDLIILSAHRKRLLSRFILGSTAENVLRHSTIPVLSVPSSEAHKSKNNATVSRSARRNSGRGKTVAINR